MSDDVHLLPLFAVVLRDHERLQHERANAALVLLLLLLIRGATPCRAIALVQGGC